MGDSDDDGDYKRRDKFRSERRGYDGSVDRGISPRHERSEWRDSRGGGSNWGRERRGGYNDGGGYRRERYPSPPGRRHQADMSPPQKRMREGHEWEDRYDANYGHGRGGGGEFYYRGPAHHRSYSAGGGGGSGPTVGTPRVAADRESDIVQPAMMTFKSFLATQDDGISDEDAIKKYSEYKLEFKRQQLNEFFVSHKDEEWFKLKYHPEESTKRRGEQKSMLMTRVEVFMDFLNKKKFAEVSIDGDQSEQLVKLLDSVVIMLEGGTEFDLQVLDRIEDDKKSEVVTEKKELTVKKEIEEGADQEKEPDAKKSDDDKSAKSRKRKREKEFDDDNDNENDNEEEVSSSSDEEEVPPGQEKIKTEEEGEEGENHQNGDDVKSANGEAEEDGKDQPRALHKTTSIFLRNLAPTITKAEVEAMCKRFSGFLRAAISEPQPERRFFRRGWVTFERNAKIKEICYSFNNIRLRDCELGPIVNRDLSRRIRTVSGLTVDKKVVRNDIRLAAKVITNLDKRWSIWEKDQQDGEEVKKEVDEMAGLTSNNPLLSNITDYLIEEASAEEEELLGKNSELEEGEEGDDGNTIVRDEELIKVLDRLLYYLRIVHSVDYYNHSEYPTEDEMPNRCGIMHARASIPAGGKAAPFEIEEYCSMFEKKMGSFLQPRSMLTDADASKLGMKNEEDEVEKFVMANTQELGKDKWLCPLSGKKFKGPDFVRKHIFNKHAEKVEEVKKEVKYYNNYLKDPRRPQLPENPQNKSSASLGRSGSQRDLGGGHRGSYTEEYHYSGHPREATSYPVYDDSRERGYDRGGYRGRPRYDNYGNRGGGRVRDRIGAAPAVGTRFGGGESYYANTNRPIITYRDLDCPTDDF